MTAILRHKNTNTLFRHVKDNIYRNLITGVEGEILPERAKEIFAISLYATALFNENENLEKLVKGLKLKISI
jgi:predicted negative regulator of RcsB-dependent stress response